MKYNLFIGRFQPLHDGHKTLLQQILDEDKNVLVALRDTMISESDPYTIAERQAMLIEAFPKETESGRMRIISIPDIEAICYGRKVGYDIREIKLDKETEAISATEIRHNLVDRTKRRR